jgi:hypothetical protein
MTDKKCDGQTVDITDCFSDVKYFVEFRTLPRYPSIKLSVPTKIYITGNLTLGVLDGIPQFIQSMTLDLETNTFKVINANSNWFGTVCEHIYRRLCEINIYFDEVKVNKMELHIE